jgi:hypothetical protein
MTEDAKLSDEQVANWRRVLANMFGPAALLFTREQIQEFRDNMQQQVKDMPVEESAKE